jgi:hypothetical protein
MFLCKHIDVMRDKQLSRLLEVEKYLHVESLGIGAGLADLILAGSFELTPEPDPV